MEQEPNNKDQAKSSPSAFMVFGFWISALFLLIVVFTDLGKSDNTGGQLVTSSFANGKLILDQNRQGHYMVNGTINGQDVLFLLDTGATNVSIPENVANRLNLPEGRAFPVMTANGNVVVRETRLDQLSLGPITFSNVEANINPGMRSEKILLGMNVLKDLQFTQRNQQLIISLPL